MDKNHYYNAKDLKKFGQISDLQKELGDKFFEWYNAVFAEGELSAREKALIALAVAHAVQCPYCIDAYTGESFKMGYSEGQMMEAVHVASAIRGGASMVHGVQMMNKIKEIGM
jgi:alkylhydroperoxidase/carboxymuconolactone decarboxylase family protein